MEARKKPLTNLGKRAQISPIPTRRSPAARFSQRVTEITARTKDQMPIQMSRPMTFIIVKERMAASWPMAAAAAKPAASANSEVPIQAPETPGSSSSHRQTKGRMKIMTVAHTATNMMVTEMWSLWDCTAPPTAMAADTPQMEAPAPRVAPNWGGR